MTGLIVTGTKVQELHKTRKSSARCTVKHREIEPADRELEGETVVHYRVGFELYHSNYFCNLTKRADLHSCCIDWLLGVAATFVFVGLRLQDVGRSGCEQKADFTLDCQHLGSSWMQFSLIPAFLTLRNKWPFGERSSL